MCKRVEGRQQTGMRGGEGGEGGGGGGTAAALVRRLSLVAGGRQKQTGGQPSEAAAGERGGAQGLERARGLEPQEGAASVFLPGGSAQPAGG